MSKYRINVIKSEFELRVLDGGVVVGKYPIAIGERADGKARIYEEDFRTPGGDFKVKAVQPQNHRDLCYSNMLYYPYYLAHKFGDPFKDLGKGAYGEGIIVLNYPQLKDVANYYRLLESGEIGRDWINFMEEKWRKVFEHESRTRNIPLDKVVLENECRRGGRFFLEGKTFAELYDSIPPQPRLHMSIHGTNDPDCIGHKVSGGCIRLHNQDIIELIKEFVEVDMLVSIEN